MIWIFNGSYHNFFYFLSNYHRKVSTLNWHLTCTLFSNINHTFRRNFTFQVLFSYTFYDVENIFVEEMQKNILFMQVCSRNCDIFIDMFSRLSTISVKYMSWYISGFFLLYSTHWVANCMVCMNYWCMFVYILNKIVHLSSELQSSVKRNRNACHILHVIHISLNILFLCWTRILKRAMAFASNWTSCNRANRSILFVSQTLNVSSCQFTSN